MDSVDGIRDRLQVDRDETPAWDGSHPGSSPSTRPGSPRMALLRCSIAGHADARSWARDGQIAGLSSSKAATLRICGTMISERGVGTYRQEHPKPDRSNRVTALPSFTAEALRRRLAIMAGPLTGRAGLRQPGGNPADHGQCATPSPQGARRRRDRGRQPAHVPPHRRDGHQRAGQPEPRLGAARTHRPRGDDRALHPTQRAGESADRRTPRRGVRTRG